AARRAPGVHLVLTAADLGELNQPSPLLIPHPTLSHPRTQRPLAVDEVRYVGEIVVLVVADDRYVAEDAPGLIAVAPGRRRGGPAGTRTCRTIARRAFVRPWATPSRRWRAPRTCCASGWRSSGAAGARSRRAASSPSGMPGARPSRSGTRPRRRFPS